jgi:ATP-dependent exoDNAse (exonuclease V) beta subunit
MSWMKERYGEATGIYKEMPFSFVNDKGQIINGEIDLVYSTAQGDVLVDYKTYQGAVSDITDKDSDFSANKYSGQISLYEEARKHKGCSIRARIICYMSLGAIVSFENK